MKITESAPQKGTKKNNCEATSMPCLRFIGSSCFQGGPKMTQDGPEMALDGPKIAQNDPKIASGWSEMAQDGPK